MNSVILRYGAKHLFVLLVVLSLIVLYRGHNAPGGGFIGGLLSATAFILIAVAHGVERAKERLRIDPVFLIGIGLLVSLLTGLLPVLIGKPLLTGLWLGGEGGGPALGTPLLFDVGVYLVVTGILLTIVFRLMEE